MNTSKQINKSTEPLEIKKPKWQTIYNQDQFPWAEKIDPISTTVPDMTLSLDEIVRRHARGIPIEGNKFAIYDGDDYAFADLTFTDKLEIETLKKEAQDELKQIINRQQERNRKIKADNEARAKQQEAELKTRIDAYFKERAADQGTTIQRTTGANGE